MVNKVPQLTINLTPELQARVNYHAADGNETPEEYVMNRVPEGVNVVKNLSPFNTKIECSAEWKPVKNFRNLSFGAKAGVHLNGRTPYPIAGVYAKIGL